MRESAEDRRQRILEIIDHRDEVKVAHLAALLGVSMVTVRRDLEALTRQGAVVRLHGKVTAPRRTTGEPAAADGAAGTVSIISPERHPYLNEVVQSARQSLQHAGYRVVLHLTPNERTPADHQWRHLIDDESDGLLLAPRWRSAEVMQAEAQALKDVALPTVLMERRPPRGPAWQHLDAVSSDHEHGVSLAVEHLVDLGHRRILLATRQDSPTARAVSTAFASVAAAHPQVEHHMSVLSSPDAAGEDHGAVVGAVQVAYPDHDDPSWLPRLLKDQGFTAALIHSDENALVLAHRLTAAGLSLPEDCAVVAYDDVVAGLGSVPLTAVAPPKAAVGQVAAQLLIERIRTQRKEQSWTPRRIELLPTLEVRDST
ncbi:substrate-binding domain-containing protein [Nesterenkonia xinjiangensis]|uniref:DNA-binding LacI/PurR family transcriptional regulator n=1 Tax=Nesterenkonia xinjiangensis TaxID=225327 RepID=A0A7Z0GJM6_9MICC|nr:DNA-binding LacI/PurR family transcriptional regulator [Nesterenkonia xinjiangensis]